MIVKSLDLLQTTLPRQWILAGGGWNNPVISREFRACLAAKLGNEISIQSADEAGWNSQALEAQIFAYFAVRSLQNKPLSVFGTTQVPVPVSGGRAHIPAVGTTAKVKELIALNPQVLQS
jgi:anhydro-N-acetylmuramic acid kinase